MAEQPAFSRSASRSPRTPQADGTARVEQGGFWHRPEWMNLVSDILLLLASVAIGYAAFKTVVRSNVFALREVVIVSPLGQVTSAQLEYAVMSSMRGNFFTVDLEHARKSFEKLPWVRNAQLRRRWPATVEVKLEEQVAVAYWKDLEAGQMRLVNRFGEIFDAASNAEMPIFSGPGDDAADMLRWRERLDELLKPIGRKVVGLNLSGRRAWQIKLDDGLILELGRDEARAPLEERLKRFVAVWPSTRERLGTQVAVADLRYPAGFAVKPVDSASRKKQ